MKKIYLLFLIWMVAVLANAQPVITKANYPNAGESFTGNVVLFNAPFTPGPNGANQTWDFSSLTNINTAPFDYVDPTSTPYASTFASSDVALSALTLYTFFSSSTSEVQITGSVIPGTSPTVIPLSDPQRVINFPFTYGDNFKDTAVSYIYNVSGGNTQRRRMSSKSIADAYGTIIVPSTSGGSPVTYNNVLRLQVSSYTLDSTFNSSNVFVKTDVSIDTFYYWISENYKPHVFALQKTKQNNNVPSTTAQFFANPALPTGVAASSYSSAFSVYPNPFSEELFIEVDEQILNTKSSLRMSILNAAGKEMANYSVGSTTTRIPRKELASGFYIYKIYTNEEVLTTGKLTVH